MCSNDKLKRLTSFIKRKAAILWDYYRIELIIGIAVVLVLVSQIYQISTAKDIALRTVFLNVSHKSESCSEYIDAFAQKALLDTDKYCIDVDTSMMFSLDLIGEEATYVAHEKLSVLFATGDVDVFASDADAFLHFAYFDYFTDLRTVFTSEQLADLHHRLYYIDGHILQEENSYNDAPGPRPSPTEPDKMQDPIPVGLIIPPDSDFARNYSIAGDTAVIGIGCTSPNVELAVSFIQYILS